MMDRLGRFEDGDDQEFGRLVNRYKERIYRVVLRIVNNNDEAKDLSQEAFVKAYMNRKAFRAESGFYTWVYRIAVNLALNYISRNRDRMAESLENIASEKTAAPPSDNLEKAELGAAISAAVDKLPPRQKTVFVLRHYEELPNAEIASMLSITEGAVKANYHQATQKLKTYLRDYMQEGRLTG
jgi:RNA polymerase sigma-70 factor (ECF subfamily)